MKHTIDQPNELEQGVKRDTEPLDVEKEVATLTKAMRYIGNLIEYGKIPRLDVKSILCLKSWISDLPPKDPGVQGLVKLYNERFPSFKMSSNY